MGLGSIAGALLGGGGSGGAGGLLGGLLGGGEGGGLASLGGIAGSIFGGPVGGMIGSALGNLLQDSVGESTKQAARQLHQQDGMPKFLVDEIKTVVKDSVDAMKNDDVDETTQKSCQDAHGDTFAEFSQQLTRSIVDAVRDQIRTGANGAEGGRSSKGSKISGGSWMQAIAESMGKVLGEKASDMVKLSEKIAAHTQGEKSGASGAAGSSGDKEKTEVDKAGLAAETQTMNAKFQATGQEFNLLQTTFSTAMKTIGEGMASVARKQ